MTPNNFITFCQILLRKKTLQKTGAWGNLLLQLNKWRRVVTYLFHASAFLPASVLVQWKHWWSASDIHLLLSWKLGKAGPQWDELQSKKQKLKYTHTHTHTHTHDGTQKAWGESFHRQQQTHKLTPFSFVYTKKPRSWNAESLWPLEFWALGNSRTFTRLKEK